MTAQTPLFIGSTSKSFTALAIMQLVEDGKIEGVMVRGLSFPQAGLDGLVDQYVATD
jgi:hypothetical protein